MKNLGITIDRILKIDPKLHDLLLPIKNKWEKYPSRAMKYWKDLGNTLNSIRNHPNWLEIRNIVISKNRPNKKLESFDEASNNEKVIGVIPENLSDIIRKNDRIAIKIAKDRIEASMTKNVETMAILSRKESKSEISMKKIWFNLKDHFKLWDKPCSYGIRKKGPFLVLVSIPNPVNTLNQTPNGGIMRMDQDMFKKFLGMMGMDPENMNPNPPPDND